MLWKTGAVKGQEGCQRAKSSSSVAGNQKIKSKPDTPRKSARNARKGTMVTAGAPSPKPSMGPILGDGLQGRGTHAHTLIHGHTHPHSLAYSHTNRHPYIHTHAHTYKQSHTHTHTHMHSKCILTLACILKSVHIYTYRHILIHHTRRGARGTPNQSQDVSSGPTGPNQKLRRAPCTQNTKGHPGPRTPSTALPHPLGAGGAVPKPGHGWHLPGSRPFPAPARPAPVLVLLRSREAPLASHLGFGRASASWLPRLTRRWAGASSELSECGRRKARAGSRDRAAPPPASRPEQTLLSHPF